MILSDVAATSKQAGQLVLNKDSAAEFDRWDTPEFNAGAGFNAGSPAMSVTQLESLQKQAYDEAYEAGLQEGRNAGQASAQAEAQRLEALTNQLARPFEDLDECVEKQVVQLAMIVARNIIRRELKVDPTHVIGAVREALAVLPVAARDVRVILHPEDAELVRKYLTPVEVERAWSIEEDPVLTRGSCRVDSEYSHVDARIESRLSALIATMFGDERESADSPVVRTPVNE